MIGYWSNFARSGDPNGNRLPHWPRYDKEKELIRLHSSITSGRDTYRPQFEFLLNEEKQSH